MSNKTRNAKKAKIESALNRLTGFIYIALVIAALASLTVQPTRLVSSKACDVKGSCLYLERATTQAEQERGLSGRSGLSNRSGMVFIFDMTGEQCMWMKDMKFNLDMIWLDKDGQVIKIAKNVTPGSYPESFCASNTKYVIEMNSGMVASLGWNLGDFIKL
jgi:uncharacterized membrane protein (UPF0127 family)